MDSPGQGAGGVCADKNSLPGTFPAGCLCHSAVAFVMALIVRRKVQAVIHS